MDSINPLISGNLQSPSSMPKKDKDLKSKKTTRQRFNRILKDSSETGELSSGMELRTPEELEVWVDEIFQLGEEVKKDATLDSMTAYRQAVGRFLKYVVVQGYQLNRQKGVMNPRTFKQKEFVNVEVVNKKLDSLAAYVLTAQKNQLEILKKVDEINGLIVDYLG